MRHLRQEQLRNYMAELVVERRETQGFLDLDVSSIEDRIVTSRFALNEQEVETCLTAHRKLINQTELSSDEQFLYEAIVLPTERPAMLIRDNSYDKPPAPWQSFDKAAVRSRIERAIRSVGRVEILGTNSPPYAGTAFVVGPGLLMTNRHVAEMFSAGRGDNVSFKEGLGSAIDFGQEKGRSDSPQTHVVREVVMCHPYWDMAVLRVPSLSVRHLDLSPLHPEECTRRKVAVLGYPAKDHRGDQQIQRRIFGDNFGVKRLQPGYVTGPIDYREKERDRNSWRTVLAHDASTLGGNSGSAVVDVETGNVIALHFAGRYGVTNYAVPAFELSRDARVRDCGVEFAEGVADRPNPWQSHWDNTSAEHAKTRSFFQQTHQQRQTIDIQISIPIRITAQVETDQTTTKAIDNG